jgi:hypothetical protein
MTFTCPHCKHKLDCSDDLAGEIAECPFCKKDVPVPKPSLPLPGQITAPDQSSKEMLRVLSDIRDSSKKTEQYVRTFYFWFVAWLVVSIIAIAAYFLRSILEKFLQ